ncbi:MAG: hypothetical protein J6W18_02815 [Bacteroidaceae bacterium]|nr:hypothetical protein [Bacteroidaceae bacterium]
MRLRRLTFIALLLLATAGRAQILNRSSLPAFSANWGAKVGFSATASYVTDAYMNGHELTEYTQDTQIGNFGTFLLRLNSRTVFLQTGFGMNCNKSCFYVDMNSWDPEATSRNELSCVFTYKSFTVPFQMGYHIINRPPYCMSAFTGARFRYTPDNLYSVQYGSLDPYQLSEKPTELIIGWTAGLSVQIGRTFLDFEYEATINTTSGPIFDMNNTEPAPDLRLDRRLGIMSFSYGILF